MDSDSIFIWFFIKYLAGEIAHGALVYAGLRESPGRGPVSSSRDTSPPCSGTKRTLELGAKPLPPPPGPRDLGYENQSPSPSSSVGSGP